jgi:hypothetical protein
MEFPSEGLAKQEPDRPLLTVADTIGEMSVDLCDAAPSIYVERARPFALGDDPSTCMTATIETVDDDRAGSLLGVFGPA